MISQHISILIATIWKNKVPDLEGMFDSGLIKMDMRLCDPCPILVRDFYIRLFKPPPIKYICTPIYKVQYNRIATFIPLIHFLSITTSPYT